MLTVNEKVSIEMLIRARIRVIESYTGEYHKQECKELQTILDKLSGLTDYSITGINQCLASRKP